MPALHILEDERDFDDETGKNKSDDFTQKEDFANLSNYLDSTREKLIPDCIYINAEKGNMPVQVAMSYNKSYTENIVSYVNNINTIEGGTHVAGFRRALTRTLKSYADKSGLLEKVKLEISGDDFSEGLTAVISVKFRSPSLRDRPKPNWAIQMLWELWIWPSVKR
jgi:DNA gyrase subunit B